MAEMISAGGFRHGGTLDVDGLSCQVIVCQPV